MTRGVTARGGKGPKYPWPDQGQVTVTVRKDPVHLGGSLQLGGSIAFPGPIIHCGGPVNDVAARLHHQAATLFLIAFA